MKRGVYQNDLMMIGCDSMSFANKRNTCMYMRGYIDNIINILVCILTGRCVVGELGVSIRL